MLQLPGNCRAGKFSVYPSNWKSPKANKNLHWRIVYWFYDISLKKKKQIKIMGMNMLNTLREKQDAIRLAIDDEVYQLQDKGYNPITKSYRISYENDEINEYTLFIVALDYALLNLHAEVETKRDIKSCLKYLTAAIKALHYDRLTINQVRRKHIRFILDQCGKTKERWSNNLFNHYRKYLLLLFKQLVQIDVIDFNPVKEIEKRSQLIKIRETLTMEQRLNVSIYLHDNYYSFWRLLQIFYASGAREIELMKVRVKDVDLTNQTFKVIIKKGKVMSEVVKVITNDILYLWQELLKDSPSDHFIFSVGLKPGLKSISRAQLTRRWLNHVKKKLGITADLYSNKHLRSTNISEKLGTKTAAELNSHTSESMVINIYDTAYNKRKLERLKNIEDAF